MAFPSLRRPDSEDTSQRIDIRREVIGKSRILNAQQGRMGYGKIKDSWTQVAPQNL